MGNFFKVRHASALAVALIIGSASTVVQASECTAYTSCSVPASAPGSQTAGNVSPSCTTTVVCSGPGTPSVGPFEFDTTRITPAPIDPGGGGGGGSGGGGGGGGGGGANVNAGADFDEEVVTIADPYPREWDYESWALQTFDEFRQLENSLKSRIPYVKGNGEAAGRLKFQCENNAKQFEANCARGAAFGKQEEAESCNTLLDSITVSIPVSGINVGLSSGSRQSQCHTVVESSFDYRMGNCAMYTQALNNSCSRITAN